MSQQQVDCLFSQFATRSGSLSCSPWVYSRESLVLFYVLFTSQNFFLGLVFSFELHSAKNLFFSNFSITVSLKAVGLSMRYSVSVILM